jgi:hypothetical protein
MTILFRRRNGSWQYPDIAGLCDHGVARSRRLALTPLDTGCGKD